MKRLKKRIDFGMMMLLIDRYGPLLEWLEAETDGFGCYEVVCHGHRPVKVRESGEWHQLEIVEYIVDASRNS